MWWWGAALAAPGVVAPAAAEQATSALTACCRQSGVVSCPTEVAVVGPGSRTVPNPSGAGGMEVTGLWRLRCAGGSTFEPHRRLVVGGMPTEGSVLGAIEPEAAACFDRSCALPEGLCLRPGTDGASKLRVVGCDDGLVPTEAQWHNPPRSLSQAPALSAGRPAAPVPSAPPQVNLAIPERPELPCTPQAPGEGISVRARMEQSNQQVDLGNDAIVAGDLAAGLDRYRAAISLNRCNAFAWTALGEALSQPVRAPQEGWLVSARLALETATLLMPSHVHAWTRLGEVSEQLGDTAAAALAYRRALEQKPGHPAALAGLARLQSASPR